MSDTITSGRAGQTVPAQRVTCDCTVCEGRTVLVPTATIDSIPAKTASRRAIVAHNLVSQRRVLGFPVA